MMCVMSVVDRLTAAIIGIVVVCAGVIYAGQTSPYVGQWPGDRLFETMTATHEDPTGRFEHQPAVLKCTLFGEDERGPYAIQIEVTTSRRVYVVRERWRDKLGTPSICYLGQPDMERFSNEVASIERARGEIIRRDLVVVSRWYDERWTTDYFDRRHRPRELEACLETVRRCEGFKAEQTPF
jgi:hypothetical protein